MNDTINILLADDHSIVVDGVSEIIKTIPNAAVVGVATNGEQLLTLARNIKAHLIILDVNMPKKDGLQCAKILKREQPNTKILFLTMYHDRALINEMIQAGANGCMLKNKGSQELRNAIARVMDNKSFFDFIPDQNEIAQREPIHLSDREVEIIKLLAQGKGSAEIADSLFISEHTVKTHRKNVMRKLDIHTAGQLVQYASSRGWA